MKKYKHGITIFRAQPLHIGNQRVIDAMIENCENITILIGSTQEHGTLRNPFNFSYRKKMIQNIYRDNPMYRNIRIIGIKDIYNDMEWSNYVLTNVSEQNNDNITVDAFFGGTDTDLHWFFGNEDISTVKIDRADEKYPYVSGTMVREMLKFGDNRWKQFVDPRNYKIVEDFINK